MNLKKLKNVYRAAQNNGWLNDICSHMSKNINIKINNMNYTKGNWTVDYNGTVGHIKAVGDNPDDKTPTVAIYNIFSKYGGKIGEKHYEEEIANAKLISAAPEMYEALKSLLDCYEKNGQLLSFDVNIARQAIKKTE